MIFGVASYYIYKEIPALDDTHHLAMQIVGIIQPCLLFCMLFLTFCKIRFRELRLRPWQIWLLLLQAGSFAAGTWLLLFMQSSPWCVVIEGGMLCMICPTATAAAVVTNKLGGNAGTLTTYTILINLAVALIVPALVPLIHPNPEFTFVKSFLIIIGKVFPLLFCPLVLAGVLRRFLPSVITWFTSIKDLAFYLWAVALCLAIAVTVRSIEHSSWPVAYQVGIAVASAIACIVQFAFGRYVGNKYGEPISAAQSCGQKNTVFAIWMGYTFMDPITSIAGGFYSVWHNIYNSYQLYQKRKH